MEADEAAGPMRVLIVEDEFFVALDLELLVRDAGHEPVGLAADAPAALRLAREARPHLALVDLNLRDGPTGPEIMRELTRDLGIAGLFVTASRGRVPRDFAGALGAVAKPYDWGTITSALGWAADTLRAGGPLPAPEGVEAAPAGP